MGIFLISSSFLLFLISLIYCIMGLKGKPIILDNAYLKATDEEKQDIDINAYRIQGVIIMAFLGLTALSNLLRILLRLVYFTYISFGILIVGTIYAIVSHYVIKRKNNPHE